MEARALVVALLLAPAALVAAQAPEALPEGCVREAELVVSCVWTFAFAPGADTFVEVELPAPGRAIVDVNVEAERPPAYGWSLRQEGRVVAGDCSGCRTEEALTLSPDPTEAPSGGQWFHFLDLRPGTEPSFRLFLDQGYVSPVAAAPAEFRVQVVLRHVPPGVQTPSEPAASAEDPQVLDRTDDQDGPPWFDIAAAWFDDAYLDDGLVEVHLLAPHLPEWDGESEPWPFFRVRWTLLGDASELDWNPRMADDEVVWTAHVHYRFVHSQPRPGGYSAGPQAELVASYDPVRGVLTAQMPLSFIGSPDPHARFTNVSAQSFGFPSVGGTGYLSDFPRDYDDASENVRPFAVGGPEVWRELRGAPPAVAAGTPPWYQAPLEPENVPDTLQALGFVGGLGMAGGGYLLVRRRRERMNRAVAEVDEAFRLHETDPEACLKALEDLEQRYDQQLLDGKMDEKQHDVLVRRIERSAYKVLKLRQR